MFLKSSFKQVTHFLKHYGYILWQIALYQVVYLSGIFYGQSEKAYFFYVAIVVFVSVHFIVNKQKKADLFLMLQVMILAVVGESFCLALGFFQFKQALLWGFFPPFWLLGMFLCFSLMLPYAMKPILDKGKLALVLAAIFGPFSYYSAMKMGALVMPNLFFSLVGLAFVWVLYMFCFQQFMFLYKKEIKK